MPLARDDWVVFIRVPLPLDYPSLIHLRIIPRSILIYGLYGGAAHKSSEAQMY